MLSSPLDAAGCSRPIPHGPIPSQSLLSQVRSSVCPLADSMGFLANVWSPRPSSSKSNDSFSSHQPESADELAATTPLSQDSFEKLTLGDTPDGKIFARPRRQSATQRTKTSFQLRYPPPTTRQKQRLNIRPKVLLQLHLASPVSRPIPTFDVLPSVIFAPRLARNFPGTFKGKAGLGVNDLVVVSSENYLTADSETDHSDDPFDSETWKSRNIVAAICRQSNEEAKGALRAEICLHQRRSWTASALPRGGYEFVSIDEHGLQQVARWIPRRKGARKQGTDLGGAHSNNASEGPAFGFSMLDPSSRRHAIIATMDAQSINISDSYSKPVPEPNDPILGATVDPHKDPNGRASIQVDEPLKTLIVVTAIFVASSEGFLPTHRYSQSAAPEVSAPSDTKSYPKRRSLSLSLARERHEGSISSGQSQPVSPVRPGIQQSGSAIVVPTSPSVAHSLPPRRTKSVAVSFMRRTSSLRYPIIEDSGPESPGALTDNGTERYETSSTTSETSTTAKRLLTTMNALDTTEVGSKQRPRGLGKYFGSRKGRITAY